MKMFPALSLFRLRMAENERGGRVITQNVVKRFIVIISFANALR